MHNILAIYGHDKALDKKIALYFVDDQISHALTTHILQTAKLFPNHPQFYVFKASDPMPFSSFEDVQARFPLFQDHVLASDVSDFMNRVSSFID